MADTTWYEWRNAANEWAERCFADYIVPDPIYDDDDEEEYDDYDCEEEE